jgi:polyisoprenoid-binding protein YceI
MKGGKTIHTEEGIMKRLVTFITFSLFLTFPMLSQASSWQIDPDHSSFQFKVRHLMVSNVKGDFPKAKGVVTMDDNDRANLKIDLTIDAASVNTGHAKRDEHLRASDFFDVAKYPTITFVSKKVAKDGPDKLKVVGDLTIHGVTREVTVDVEGPTQEIKDPWGNLRRGATATTRINRKDFGLTWNRALETGGVVVGEDVDIFVEIELIKK